MQLQRGNKMNEVKTMITYTFKKVKYNNLNGWFAVRRINGLYSGHQFGKTKALAKQAFKGV
jgi:hypothetical protein